MSPFISAATQVFLLIFACPRRSPRSDSNSTSHNGKQREHDAEKEPRQTEVSLVESEDIEKTGVYVETEKLSPYEDTLERTTLQKTALARCTNLSIIHRKPYAGVKANERSFVDPRDEEAARLAEEEEGLYVLKERATVGTEQNSQKPSRLRRLTTKLDPRPKNSKDMGRV